MKAWLNYGCLKAVIKDVLFLPEIGYNRWTLDRRDHGQEKTGISAQFFNKHQVYD